MPYTPLELANIFIQTGELDDALDALNQHLQTSPHDDEVRRLRMDVLMRMRGKEAEALKDFAALHEPTSQDRMRESVLYERMGDWTQAVRAMEAALLLAPDDERLTERYIHLLQMKGDLSQALTHLQKMPHTWRWLQWTGDITAEVGDLARAVAAYTQALALLRTDTLSPSWAAPFRARILLARAAVYRKQEALDLAEADYTAANTLIPDDPMIAFGRGVIAQLRGDTRTALDLITHAYHSGSERLREEFRDELESDVRYDDLRRKVLE